MVKVMVALPEELLSEINEASKELRTNRSQLFRQAIIKYLDDFKRKRFEKLMAEGYQEMAEEDQADAEGFLGGIASLDPCPYFRYRAQERISLSL